MTATHDPRTLDYYSTSAAPYLASRPDRHSRHLELFMNALPKGGRVLELGCGSGRDTQVLLRQGFDVEPTDGCAEIAAIAETELGRPVKVMRHDQLDAFDEFDGVWANATLLHVPRSGLAHVLTLIRRALKANGVHYANYKSGAQDGRDDRDRYYNYLSPEDMLKTYSASGPWRVLQTFAYESDKRYETSQASWVGLLAQKVP